MKRKIMQHGPATLVVSLPSKWLKRKNISKGDEIDIDEVPEGLLINSESKLEVKIAEIDISGMPKMIKRIIASLYFKGYSEINMKFSSKEELNAIQKAVPQFIGLELTDQKSNVVVVKKLADPQEDEYHNMVRKYFLLVLSISKGVTEKILNDENDEFDTILTKDTTINRFSDYCRMLLLTKVMLSEREKSMIYIILSKLQKISRSYLYLSDSIIYGEKESKNLIKEIKVVNNFLREFYELFYKFDLNKMNKLFIDQKEYINMVTEKMKKSDFNPKNYHLTTITNHIIEMTGPLLSLNMKSEK